MLVILDSLFGQQPNFRSKQAKKWKTSAEKPEAAAGGEESAGMVRGEMKACVYLFVAEEGRTFRFLKMT